MTLARFLRWDAEPALAARYEATFQRRAEGRLSSAVSRVAGPFPGLADSVAGLIADLPPSSVLRVAAAPELEYRLRLSKTEAEGVAALAVFLCRSFEAELLRLENGCGARAGGEVWTALGDYGFVERPNGRGAAPRGGGFEVLRSPVIGGNIPVDFSSPHARGDVPLRFPECEPLTARERSVVVGRLNEAFELVRGAGPEVEWFVETFTKVVVPLKVGGGHAHAGSFSSSWYPGRTVVLNPASPKVPVSELAESLVHEAIHFVVDASELGGRLLAEGRSYPSDVTSPWTGASLGLTSLLDAYFVWFGLKCFWARLAERNVVSRELCEANVRACLKGFAPEFGAVLGEGALRAVHPLAREAIEALRLEVVSSA